MSYLWAPGVSVKHSAPPVSTDKWPAGFFSVVGMWWWVAGTQDSHDVHHIPFCCVTQYSSSFSLALSSFSVNVILGVGASLGS